MPISGLELIVPSTIAYTGTSATIGANGQVTFTTISSLSLNGVFSSTYTNYMISLTAVGSSTNTELLFYLRANGVDDTTQSNYTVQNRTADSTTLNASQSTSIVPPCLRIHSSRYGGATLYIFGPYATDDTKIRSVEVNGIGPGNRDYVIDHQNASAFDGITFLDVSQSVSGSVSVYGFVK